MKINSFILVLTIQKTCQICMNDYAAPYYWNIDCEDFTIKTMQNFLTNHRPSTIESVEIKNINLPTICPGDLSFGAKKLFLLHNNITSIMPGAFTKLGKIQELRIRDNNFTHLSRGIFNSLTDVHTLDLSRNCIQKIEHSAFVGMVSMKMIFLQSNKLYNFPANVFKGLFKLERIDISGNNLVHLTTEAFTNLTHLQELHMNASNLKSIPNLRQTIVIKLDVSSNNIKNLESEFLPITLEVLDLSFNDIEKLIENTFSRFTKLQKLNLRCNKLKYLNPGLFNNLELLEILDLSENKIEISLGVFYGLKNLTQLKMNGNHLKYIPEIAFHNMQKLEMLDVSDNYLNSKNVEGILKVARLIKKIWINNNNFSCPTLYRLFVAWQMQEISIMDKPTENFQNIHGIACTYDHAYHALQNDITAKLSEDNNAHYGLSNSLLLSELIKKLDNHPLNSYVETHKVFVFLFATVLILIVSFFLFISVNYLRKNHYVNVTNTIVKYYKRNILKDETE